MKRIYLNTFVVLVVSLFWSAQYYFNSPYIEGHLRPYAYRALVPYLAGILELVGLRFDLGLILIMTLSGVGFYLALRLLALEFSILTVREELGLVVGVLVSLFVFGFYRKPYDLMTAFLFTLGFYYIWEVDVWKYLVVLALATINRETSFLLILLSVVIWFPLLKQSEEDLRLVVEGWIYSAGTFVIITYVIRTGFSSYPGYLLLVDPIGNLRMLASHPYAALLGIVVVSGMVAWMFRKPQPAFLKFSFVILSPILMLMYLVCGQPFEIRVFWELAPVVILLMVL
jgi:hypothetical protein